MFRTLSIAFSLSVSGVLPVYAAPIRICEKAADSINGLGLVSVGDPQNPRILKKSDFAIKPILSTVDISELKEFNRNLRSESIQLLIISIPPSGFFYGNQSVYPKGFDLKLAIQRYIDQISIAKQSGFSVINMYDVISKSESIGKPFFAFTDHHWTADGMEATVRAVVTVVKRMNTGIEMTSKTKLSRRDSEYPGSYIYYLDNLCGSQHIPIEHRDIFDLAIDSGEGLLGDVNSDTVVIGDSFGEDYMGFPKVLSDGLKTPITNYALSGGGPYGGVTSYLTRLTSFSKPKLIVWVATDMTLLATDMRELNATFKGVLHPNTALEEQIGHAQNGSVDFHFKSDQQLYEKDQYIQMKIDGSKIEEIVARLSYSDGSTETRTFNRRQDTPGTSFSTTFYYRLPAHKKIISISMYPARDISVTASIHLY